MSIFNFVIQYEMQVTTPLTDTRLRNALESTGRNVQRGGGIRASRYVKEEPGSAETVPVLAGNPYSDDGVV